MPSNINFKDISLLTQKSTIDGSEKFPVSDTEYVTANQIASLGGGGGDTSSCVHKTGDETIAGDKTFTDDIIIGDASNIKYGASSGSGFTRGMAWSFLSSSSNSITFTSLSGEPKAFILVWESYAVETSQATVIGVVGDSTGCRGIYTTGTQHNYSSNFTKSYSNGSFTVTAPTGVNFTNATFTLVYYYGDGALAFRTSQVSPGSGITSVTFTGTGLTEVPAMYACFLETQVNNESYRRVAMYTNSFFDFDDTEDVVDFGVSFYSSAIHNTTDYFTVSYNNGLYINSGGTNAGGYFHNPGTYTLYYLMASDIGSGGSGSYSSLADELAAINTTIGNIATILASI